MAIFFLWNGEVVDHPILLQCECGFKGEPDQMRNHKAKHR